MISDKSKEKRKQIINNRYKENKIKQKLEQEHIDEWHCFKDGVCPKCASTNVKHIPGIFFIIEHCKCKACGYKIIVPEDEDFIYY
jgi:hypothetical protein